MTYIVSEDTRISGKWIQLVSLSGYKEPASHPANQSASRVICVFDRQTDFT